jgi:tetratricopeptide (TPR) repeat protein
MRAAVKQFHGTVSKEVGDGIVAVFGAPKADDDHGRFACHAGIELVRLIDELGDCDIRVRVGLHTSQVLAYIVSSDVSNVYELGGSAQHLVERLQSIASPGQIIASEACRALADGYITFQALEPQTLKGFQKPVPLFQVVGPQKLTTWQVRKSRKLGKFVGRQDELAHLKRLASRVITHGEAIEITGDPGIGKSRLVHEFIWGLSAASWRTIEVECSPVLQDFPFASLRAFLKSALSLRPQEQQAVDSDEPSATLPQIWHSAIRAVLDLPVSDSAWVALEPARRGRAIVDATKALLVMISQQSRVALLIEDVQWVDGASEGALESLKSLLPQHPIFLITTHRTPSKFDLPIEHAPTRLSLRSLNDAEGQDMLDDILDRPSPEIKARILKHTGAIPLFIEEVCRDIGMRDGLQGNRVSDGLRIPATVQGVIATRVDRLSTDEKSLLRMAAVFGSRSTSAMLGELFGLPEPQLKVSLASLARSELLIEASTLPDQTYEFPHDLIRQVAYEAMPGNARKDLHRRIFLMLKQDRFASSIDQSEFLLHHAVGAEHWSEAASLSTAIARKCLEKSAHPAAVTYYELALDALDKSPFSIDRERAAIDLRIEARVAFSSFGVFDRWLDIAKDADKRAQAISDPARTVAAMAVRAAALNFHGTPVRAIELGEDVVQRAITLQDDGWLSYAKYGLGQAYFVAGKCREASSQFEQACSHLRGPNARAPLGNTPERLLLTALMMWAAALGTLGEWDAADDALEQARLLSRRSTRSIDQVAVGYSAGSILLNQGDFLGATLILEGALKVASEHETKLYVPIVSCLCGIANLEQGLFDIAEGYLKRATVGAQQVGHASVQLRAPAYSAILVEQSQGAAAAISQLENIRALAKQHGYHGLEAETWLCEARVRSAGSVESKAGLVDALRKCLDLAESLGHAPLVARAARMLEYATRE